MWECLDVIVYSVELNSKAIMIVTQVRIWKVVVCTPKVTLLEFSWRELNHQNLRQCCGYSVHNVQKPPPCNQKAAL
jgi:hypothetical protein